MRDSSRIGPVGAPIASGSTPAWTSSALDQQIIDAFVADDGIGSGSLAPDSVSESLIRDRARVLGLTKEFTKKCRRSGSRAAMRTCMKCDLRFLSAGIHNRLCQRCRPR